MYINIDNASNVAYNLELYDLLGKHVFSSLINATYTELSIASLCAGVYYYKIKDKEKILKQGKLVITK